ncbi:AbrB/MazE/SpoVT family DNA-binding domain-containing protein [Eubacteriales bacterium KG127]
MKTTGITRPVDALGRVVIPVELRRGLNINTDDYLEIFVDGDYIMLKKYEASCIFCGSKDNVKDVRGKNVCQNCIDELKQL